jgi:hypothetical protein
MIGSISLVENPSFSVLFALIYIAHATKMCLLQSLAYPLNFGSSSASSEFFAFLQFEVRVDDNLGLFVLITLFHLEIDNILA